MVCSESFYNLMSYKQKKKINLKKHFLFQLLAYVRTGIEKAHEIEFTETRSI